jgi:hypothetical protein
VVGEQHSGLISLDHENINGERVLAYSQFDSSGFGDPTFRSPSRQTKVHDPNSTPIAIVSHHHDIFRLYVAVKYLTGHGEAHRQKPKFSH